MVLNLAKCGATKLEILKDIQKGTMRAISKERGLSPEEEVENKDHIFQIEGDLSSYIMTSGHLNSEQAKLLNEQCDFYADKLSGLCV